MKLFRAFLAFGLVATLGACTTVTPPIPLGLEASSSSKQHNEAGIQHYQMEHWDVAKKHFEAAVQADPTQAEPHFNLGLALHQLGSHPEATTHFKKAVELDPTNSAMTYSDVYQSHMGVVSQGYQQKSYGGGYY
ncbi:MAG: tetratricopeptide repeat protein [Nitrospirota bacterium]|nr:tetratricopeptide repeat protein [Nitrospirota bacterium]